MAAIVSATVVVTWMVWAVWNAAHYRTWFDANMIIVGVGTMLATVGTLGAAAYAFSTWRDQLRGATDNGTAMLVLQAAYLSRRSMLNGLELAKPMIQAGRLSSGDDVDVRRVENSINAVTEQLRTASEKLDEALLAARIAWGPEKTGIQVIFMTQLQQHFANEWSLSLHDLHEGIQRVRKDDDGLFPFKLREVFAGVDDAQERFEKYLINLCDEIEAGTEDHIATRHGRPKTGSTMWAKAVAPAVVRKERAATSEPGATVEE